AFLSPGVHELILVPSDTSHSLIVDFTAAEGVGYSAFAIDSTAGATHTVEPVIVPDTGSLPAVGHSRLRIASYAPGAPPIDAWRTQPDSSGLVMSAQPLNFRALTRFFDGAPGAWSVVISHAGITDTLIATGPIAMADGQEIGRASCRERGERWPRDWSSDVCSSDLTRRGRRRSTPGAHSPTAPGW